MFWHAGRLFVTDGTFWTSGVQMVWMQPEFPSQQARWLTGWARVGNFRRLCEAPKLMNVGALTESGL